MYKSVDEYALGKSIFEENLLKIDELNEKYKGETTFKMNKFIDLLPEEGKSYLDERAVK